MTNELLTHAIALHDMVGDDFAGLLAWHTLHGVVVVDADVVFLGYYCTLGDIITPVALERADCLFVSYYGGDMRCLWGRYGTFVDFIVYDRVFGGRKSCIRFQTAGNFRKIIEKLTKGSQYGRINTNG